MKLSDIMNRPISIGDGQHLTLKQIVESSFTRANNIDAGLKQADTFFTNLGGIIDMLTTTEGQNGEDPASAGPEKRQADGDPTWKDDPEAARALIVFNIVTQGYARTSRPVGFVAILDDIHQHTLKDLDADDLFGDALQRHRVAQQTLDALHAEGLIVHTALGYLPASVKAKSPRQESQEEDPAVKAQDPDPVREFLDEVGLGTKVGEMDVLDELRNIGKGSSILPLATGIAGAAIGICAASLPKKDV